MGRRCPPTTKDQMQAATDAEYGSAFVSDANVERAVGMCFESGAVRESAKVSSAVHRGHVASSFFDPKGVSD